MPREVDKMFNTKVLATIYTECAEPESETHSVETAQNF